MTKKLCTSLSSFGTLLFALWSTGCYSYTSVQKADLGDFSDETLQVNTSDGYVYTLNRWEVLPDSSIVGSGSSFHKGVGQEFEGKIESERVKDLTAIQFRLDRTVLLFSPVIVLSLVIIISGGKGPPSSIDLGN